MKSLFPPILEGGLPNGQTRTDLFLANEVYVKSIKRTKLSPIVICPGLGGTCLDFQLDESIQLSQCTGPLNDILLKYEKILWLNPIGLSLQRDCFLTLLKPIYNKLTQTLMNITGLNTSVHGTEPGDILACKCLSYILKTTICFPETNYARNFINFFVAAGYVSNQNLYTVGYDFRLVPYPNYLELYILILKQVIESAYMNNQQQKVYLIGHSLGCSLTNIFLNLQTQTWKDTYIAGFIPISPAYDGGPKALRTCLSGDNFGLPTAIFGQNIDYRSAERTMAGVIATIPLHSQMYSGKKLSDGTAAILYTTYQPTIIDVCSKIKCVPHINLSAVYLQSCQNYNVNDFKYGIIGILKALAKDLHQPELRTTARILKKIQHQRQKYGWTDPHVTVNQLMVTNLPTEGGAYAYNLSENGLNNDPSTYRIVDGDGTVPLYGLYIPKTYKWLTITYQIFTDADHYTLFVDSPAAYQYILNIVAT